MTQDIFSGESDLHSSLLDESGGSSPPPDRQRSDKDLFDLSGYKEDKKPLDTRKAWEYVGLYIGTSDIDVDKAVNMLGKSTARFALSRIQLARQDVEYRLQIEKQVIPKVLPPAPKAEDDDEVRHSGQQQLRLLSQVEEAHKLSMREERIIDILSKAKDADYKRINSAIKERRKLPSQ